MSKKHLFATIGAVFLSSIIVLPGAYGDKGNGKGSKVCQAGLNLTNVGTVYNDLAVSPSWTVADCEKWSKSFKNNYIKSTSYRLGCMTNHGVTYQAGKQVPACWK